MVTKLRHRCSVCIVEDVTSVRVIISVQLRFVRLLYTDLVLGLGLHQGKQNYQIIVSEYRYPQTPKASVYRQF